MDALNNVKPGQTLSESQKAELAKSNADASAEAQRLAAEHRQRDIAEGRGGVAPVAQDVASSIKDKLEREAFTPK